MTFSSPRTSGCRSSVVGTGLQQPRPDQPRLADRRHLVDNGKAVAVEQPDTNPLVKGRRESGEPDLGGIGEREVVPVEVVGIEGSDSEAQVPGQAVGLLYLVERNGLGGRDRLRPSAGTAVIGLVTVDPADKRPAPLVGHRKGAGRRDGVLEDLDIEGGAGVDFEGNLERVGTGSKTVGGVLRNDPLAGRRDDPHLRAGGSGGLDPGDDVAAAGVRRHGELIVVPLELYCPGAVDDLTGLAGLVGNAFLLGLRGHREQQQRRKGAGCSSREARREGVASVLSIGICIGMFTTRVGYQDIFRVQGFSPCLETANRLNGTKMSANNGK